MKYFQIQKKEKFTINMELKHLKKVGLVGESQAVEVIPIEKDHLLTHIPQTLVAKGRRLKGLILAVLPILLKFLNSFSVFKDQVQVAGQEGGTFMKLI